MQEGKPVSERKALERPPRRERHEAKPDADAAEGLVPGEEAGEQAGAEAADAPADPEPASGVELWTQVNGFLDHLAGDHREQMERVVNYLWRSGNLEREIHDSVKAITGLFNKWSFEIMFLLRIRGTMRFNQLREELAAVGPDSIGKKVKDLAGVGSRTLSSRLKELESQGMIRRDAYPEVPVRVEYTLTRKGMRFGDLMMPVIAHLRLWDDLQAGK